MIDLIEMKVLFVDDMEQMFKSLRGMMKVLGYGKKFFYARNGLEAWNLLKEVSVDLAIIDWNMPVMTGVELLARIREDRNLRDMPIIMATAEANREIVAEVAESDIDSYILKPLTVKSLGDRILSVVNQANNPPPMIQHLKQARAFEEAGEMEKAIAEAKKALKAEPNSSRPLRELGYLYFQKKDLDTAEKCFLKAANMNRLDVFACHHLGELYLQREDMDNAEKYFDRAMNISPRHVSRGINFGKILVQKNLPGKAVKVFNKAIGLSEDAAKTREDVAEFCLQNGLCEYAVALIDFILRKNPTRYDLMYKAGIAYESLKDHAKSIKYFLEAEKNDKQNVNIKLHIAKSYMAMKQVLRADAKLRDIIKLDPDNLEARELLKQNV